MTLQGTLEGIQYPKLVVWLTPPPPTAGNHATHLDVVLLPEIFNKVTKVTVISRSRLTEFLPGLVVFSFSPYNHLRLCLHRLWAPVTPLEEPCRTWRRSNYKFPQFEHFSKELQRCSVPERSKTNKKKPVSNPESIVLADLALSPSSVF